MDRTKAVILIVAGAFLALVLVAFFGLERGGERSLPPRPAPEFELPTLEGRKVSLASLRGSPVLVNFWATWCPPCVEETPSLEALYRRFAPQGLRVLGISVDEDGDLVRRFVAAHGITFPILLDPSAETPRRYGTFKYPETFFVDPAGRIVRRWIGPVAWTRAEVLAEVQARLRER